MKTLSPHRLFLALFFVLFGIVAQNNLVAMNDSGPGNQQELIEQQLAAMNHQGLGLVGLGLQPTALTRIESLQSVDLARPLADEFGDFDVNMNKEQAQAICADVLDCVKKHLSKKYGKNEQIDKKQAEEICTDVLGRVKKNLSKKYKKNQQKALEARIEHIRNALKKLCKQIFEEDGNKSFFYFIEAVQEILENQGVGILSAEEARRGRIRNALKKLCKQIFEEDGNKSFFNFIEAIQEILENQGVDIVYNEEQASRFIQLEESLDFDDKDFQEFAEDQDDGKASEPTEDVKMSNPIDDGSAALVARLIYQDAERLYQEEERRSRQRDEENQGEEHKDAKEGKKSDRVSFLVDDDQADQVSGMMSFASQTSHQKFTLLPAAAADFMSGLTRQSSNRSTPMVTPLSSPRKKEGSAGSAGSAGTPPRHTGSRNPTPQRSPQLGESKRPGPKIGSPTLLRLKRVRSIGAGDAQCEFKDGVPSQQFALGDVKISLASKSSPKKESKDPHVTPQGTPTKTKPFPTSTPPRQASHYRSTSELLRRFLINNIIRISRTEAFVDKPDLAKALAELRGNPLVRALTPLIQRMFSLREDVKNLAGGSGDVHQTLCMIIFQDRDTIFDFLSSVVGDYVDHFLMARIEKINADITTHNAWNKRPVSNGVKGLIAKLARKEISKSFTPVWNGLIQETKYALTFFKEIEEQTDVRTLLAFIFEYYSWQKFYKDQTWLLDCMSDKEELLDVISRLGGPLRRLIHMENVFDVADTPRNVNRFTCAVLHGSPCDYAISLAALQAQEHMLAMLDTKDAKLAQKIRLEQYGEVKKAVLAMKIDRTAMYNQNANYLVRLGCSLEQHLLKITPVPLIAPTDCVFNNRVIFRDLHTMGLTLDREDELDFKSVTQIQGGHFAKSRADLPCKIQVPAGLCNDSRGCYEDKILDMKEVKAAAVAGADAAVRVVEWVVQYDEKNPLFSAPVSGNGTFSERKTLFPDCFKPDFGAYVEALHSLTKYVNDKEPRMNITTPFGKVTVILKEMRGDTNIYSFVHQHSFGCCDLACPHRAANGKIEVTMYVRREVLSPTHTLTTIMSIHPVL